MRKLASIISILLAACGGGGSGSNSSGGCLRVYVSDLANDPVPGAVVQIDNNSAGAKTTNNQGMASFCGLTGAHAVHVAYSDQGVLKAVSFYGIQGISSLYASTSAFPISRPQTTINVSVPNQANWGRNYTFLAYDSVGQVTFKPLIFPNDSITHPFNGTTQIILREEQTIGTTTWVTDMWGTTVSANGATYNLTATNFPSPNPRAPNVAYTINAITPPPNMTLSDVSLLMGTSTPLADLWVWKETNPTSPISIQTYDPYSSAHWLMVRAINGPDIWAWVNRPAPTVTASFAAPPTISPNPPANTIGWLPAQGGNPFMQYVWIEDTAPQPTTLWEIFLPPNQTSVTLPSTIGALGTPLVKGQSYFINVAAWSSPNGYQYPSALSLPSISLGAFEIIASFVTRTW